MHHRYKQRAIGWLIDGLIDLQERVRVADVEHADDGGQGLHVPLPLVEGKEPRHEPLRR